MKFRVWGLSLMASFLSVGAVAAQDSGSPLLRLQRSNAYLDIESNAKHAQGLNGITFGNPGDVWHYPNSLACLVVYEDGKYVFERRDEQTLGRPKIKATQGALNGDEIQQLKTMLNDPTLQKVATPPMPEMPDDAVAVKEIETIAAHIGRQGTTQDFMLVKERFKTTAMTGLDKWMDNSGQYQKSLVPLLKWFKDLEKKSKSGLKDSTPQYCEAMNIG